MSAFRTSLKVSLLILLGFSLSTQKTFSAEKGQIVRTLLRGLPANMTTTFLSTTASSEEEAMNPLEVTSLTTAIAGSVAFVTMTGISVVQRCKGQRTSKAMTAALMSNGAFWCTSALASILNGDTTPMNYCIAAINGLTFLIQGAILILDCSTPEESS